jgi:hypothetical protein
MVFLFQLLDASVPFILEGFILLHVLLLKVHEVLLVLQCQVLQLSLAFFDPNTINPVLGEFGFSPVSILDALAQVIL